METGRLLCLSKPQFTQLPQWQGGLPTFTLLPSAHFSPSLVN